MFWVPTLVIWSFLSGKAQNYITKKCNRVMGYLVLNSHSRCAWLLRWILSFSTSPLAHPSNTPQTSPLVGFPLPYSLCRPPSAIPLPVPWSHTLRLLTTICFPSIPAPSVLFLACSHRTQYPSGDDIVMISSLTLIQVYEAATPNTVDGLSVPVELVPRLLTISTAHDKSLSSFL